MGPALRRSKIHTRTLWTLTSDSPAVLLRVSRVGARNSIKLQLMSSLRVALIPPQYVQQPFTLAIAHLHINLPLC